MACPWVRCHQGCVCLKIAKTTPWRAGIAKIATFVGLPCLENYVWRPYKAYEWAGIAKRAIIFFSLPRNCIRRPCKQMNGKGHALSARTWLSFRKAPCIRHTAIQASTSRLWTLACMPGSIAIHVGYERAFASTCICSCAYAVSLLQKCKKRMRGMGDGGSGGREVWGYAKRKRGDGRRLQSGHEFPWGRA